MTKLTVCAMSMALLVTLNAMAGDTDKCLCSSTNALTVGWCQVCGHGIAYTYEPKSEKLVQALQGQDVDPAKVSCPGCKKAAESAGACCGKSYVNKKAYGSPVSAAMASGTLASDSKTSCESCKTAIKSGKGYCDKCKAGVLHGVVYDSKEEYDDAVMADTILTAAIGAKCEGCAVAMVIDGTCAHCKTSFKDGQPKKS